MSSYKKEIGTAVQNYAGDPAIQLQVNCGTIAMLRNSNIKNK
jgi:hypothetical protein